MAEHAYLPTTIICNEGSAFVSQVIKEVADVLGTTREHAKSKHVQTIELFEQSHASRNKSLTIET